ncbi:MAG: hypothetical protein JNK93_03070 [Planctomycetia bacterium]|nr:hypothetical protein [Planctomycetia bacterium]
MNSNRFGRWSEIRERGERDYVRRYGILYVGSAMAMLFSISPLLMMEDDRHWWIKLILAWIVWPIAGYYWGKWMWKYMERLYLEAQQADQGRKESEE